MAERTDDERRRCVACGYDLQGLDDPPRCPECGLVNTSSTFREEAWRFVDSRSCFFSGFFDFVSRRPPGWWWALDRPDDVPRSFRFAGLMLLVSALLVFGAGAVASSVRYVETWSGISSVPRSSSDSGEIAFYRYEVRTVYGMGGEILRWDWDNEWPDPSTTTPRAWARTSGAVIFEPSWDFLARVAPLYAWLILMWAVPALVGLWTQIRKNLPSFARAPRTIIAASNYESHRLIYLAVLVVCWTVLDAGLRVGPLRAAQLPYSWGVLILLLPVFGAAGWIGPLRSDYTHQLVRSRLHAVRVLVMYAVFLPALMVGATTAALTWL